MGPLPTRWRKVGTTSNHHAPYDLGYTRNTMAVNNGKRRSDPEQNQKNGLSSDCRLQLACMKSELLVIANQHVAVNTFPGLVHTARHTMGVCNTRSQQSNVRGRCRRWDKRLGWSRNKVAVSEGAAGSPPFYGERKSLSISYDKHNLRCLILRAFFLNLNKHL